MSSIAYMATLDVLSKVNEWSDAPPNVAIPVAAKSVRQDISTLRYGSMQAIEQS